MPPKKDKPPAKDHFPDVMIFLFTLVLLSMLAWRADTSGLLDLWHRFVDYLRTHVWPLVKIIGVIVSLLSVPAIITLVRRLNALGAEEALYYHGPFVKDQAEEIPYKNTKWEKIVAHINSENPSDWRQAIIEADIMLDDMLRAQGYHGDSIGDMLKEVDKSDMLSLDAAWEAHKVRNRIAHDGADYALNQRDAKRVVSLYGSVFQEFKII